MLGDLQNYADCSLHFLFRPDDEEILKKPFKQLVGREKKEFVDAFIRIKETENKKRWEHLANQGLEDLIMFKNLAILLTQNITLDALRDLQKAINVRAINGIQLDFNQLSVAERECFLFAYKNITEALRWKYLLCQNSEGLQKIVDFLQVQLHAENSNTKESKYIKKSTQETIVEVQRAIDHSNILSQNYGNASAEDKFKFIETFRNTAHEVRKSKLSYQSEESLCKLIKDLQNKRLPMYSALILEVDNALTQKVSSSCKLHV